MTAKIRPLPAFLIDQIKAGEVIERPSSLLKELIENSIDANSTSISITIKENGLNLLQIEDNGEGISFDEMPLAFTRHATSKISSFDDLYRLQSFGFRGEALASAASISRITCTTLTDNKEGGKLVLEAGKIISHDQFYPSRRGTVISVKDLFFNTPARLKFIQSKTAEKNQLKKVFQFFLLSYPHIEFSIKWDDADKKLYQAYDRKDYRSRFKEIIFSKKEERKDLLDISADYEGHKITGYISRLSSKGNSGKVQFLFVNGRMFFDKAIHQIILKCAESYWPHGESGHYVFFFDVPADLLDVNIHPHKTQIKLFKYSLVQSLLSSTIRKSLVENNTIAQAESFDEEDEIDLRHYIDDANASSLAEFKNKFSKINSTVFKVTNRFYFKNEEGQLYLCDAFSVIKDFILNNFFGQVKQTPLLVSEPISGETIEATQRNQALLILNRLGFELDYLSKDNIYIFRTYPDFLGPISFKPFFYFLLKCIKEKNIYETPKLLNTLESFEFIDFSQVCLELLPEEMFNILEKTSTSQLQVNDSSLNDLFLKLFHNKA